MRLALALVPLALFASITVAEPTAAPGPSPIEPEKTWSSVVDLLDNRDSLAPLLEAVQAANLTDVLSDPDLVATIFAPTATAFNKTLTTLGISLDDLLADTEQLTSVLRYHVVLGVAATSADLQDGQVLQTALEGPTGQLTFEATVTKPRLLTTSGQRAKVMDADLSTGAAVVHLISEVLIPGSEYFDGAAATPAPAPDAAASPSPSPSPPAAPSPPPPYPPVVQQCSHIVAAAEFFFGIAEKYGLTPEELQALNPQVTNQSSLPLGSSLNVPCNT